jgi:hypothetical protein
MFVVSTGRLKRFVGLQRATRMMIHNDFEVPFYPVHPLILQSAVTKLNDLQSNAEAIKKWRETRTQDPSASLRNDMIRFLDYVSVDVSASSCCAEL